MGQRARTRPRATSPFVISKGVHDRPPSSSLHIKRCEHVAPAGEANTGIRLQGGSKLPPCESKKGTLTWG